MTLRRLIAIIALALLAAAGFAPAQAQPRPTNIRAELVAEKPAMPGEKVTLAFVMKPDKGWHGYWRNPGDAGQGMRTQWFIGNAKVAGGTLMYPTPETLLISGLMNHVYEHDYAVLAQFTVPQDARPGSVLPLRVKAEWLACTDQICVPEAAELATGLTVGKGRADPRFDGWRAALPAPLGAEAKFELGRDAIRLGIPMPAGVKLEKPHLFAGEDHVVDYAAAQAFARNGDWLIVTLKRPKIAAIDPASFTGVLRLNAAGDGVELTAVPGQVPAGGTPLKGDAATDLSLPMLLLAALAGGLLLNVMPCVFPILSLKALSLARAGESEAEARREGLAYTAGVVLACAALGALLLALRAGGEEVGWAFQLQEPGVVVVLLLLATAITANLLGLYEFAVPGFAREGSPQGAFATGLLAAFAATPCTGPFMAAAMGAALLLPVAEGMALFIALGLGLALPFLAVAYVPALRGLLPRPGKWMVWFRKLMAVPMALTALALLWLCWRLGGDGFAVLSAFLALALIVALWSTGRRQRAGKAAGWMLAAMLVLIGLVGVEKLPRLYAPGHAGIESILDAKPFSEEALAKARASGRPVFVYFTADWCLTCKVNEKAAIEREETKSAFDKAGVQVLVGDWTRRDPAITRFLTEQGAAGVPLYLWYAPGKDTEQLPQVLSVGLLIEKAGSRGD
ncbi:protein-disulfide reductase DsbD [Novosphingobium sp. TH158]|uniref:protein-disulfide reductase DsbD family protein n=1 Tax=Novosphingobium sp. TH158 TaxID=2067455 RepID=UPI000C7DBF74|nr:thioredoxin family protein [Novosphingobium sp. TH158]PLK27661.1 thiol:disulfide interchange protein [Novosphingobium sp. TH158]